MNNTTRIAGSLLTLFTSAACAGPTRSAVPATSDEVSPTTNESPPADTGPATVADSTVSDGAIEGMFDVGGHELYLRCVGDGRPTVVYLHGYIWDPDGGGGSNAGQIPDLLADTARVCVYDRANVGRSDEVNEHQSGADSVNDLHALLASADIEAPYILLGASFGGLLAYLYAGTYPNDVAGMVLLDPPVPQEPAWMAEWVPGLEIAPDEWEHTTDGVDWLPTYDEAAAAAATLPAIPVTLIAPSDPEFEDVPHDGLLDYRDLHIDLVEPFDPGVVVLAYTPHYMEPVIPELIANEVRQVIDATI